MFLLTAFAWDDFAPMALLLALLLPQKLGCLVHIQPFCLLQQSCLSSRLLRMRHLQEPAFALTAQPSCCQG